VSAWVPVLFNTTQHNRPLASLWKRTLSFKMWIVWLIWIWKEISLLEEIKDSDPIEVKAKKLVVQNEALTLVHYINIDISFWFCYAHSHFVHCTPSHLFILYI
jgi:hypothetical protein